MNTVSADLFPKGRDIEIQISLHCSPKHLTDHHEDELISAIKFPAAITKLVCGRAGSGMLASNSIFLTLKRQIIILSILRYTFSFDLTVLDLRCN